MTLSGSLDGDGWVRHIAAPFLPRPQIGRIDKSIHNLTHIDDETKRRTTLIQLKRGEGRHSFARMAFHGQKGELRQRYLEGQEDQLGALGLVENMIVLWSTIYIEAVLDQLRKEGSLSGTGSG